MCFEIVFVFQYPNETDVKNCKIVRKVFTSRVHIIKSVVNQVKIDLLYTCMLFVNSRNSLYRDRCIHYFVTIINDYLLALEDRGKKKFPTFSPGFSVTFFSQMNWTRERTTISTIWNFQFICLFATSIERDQSTRHVCNCLNNFH